MSCPNNKTRKLSLFCLLFIFLLDNYSLSVIYPIFTGLIMVKAKQLTLHTHPFSERLPLLGLAMGIFPATLLIGWLSFHALLKKIQLKKLLIISLIGMVLFFPLTGLAIFYGSYKGLVLSRALAGFFAGNLYLVLFMLSNLFIVPKARHEHFSFLSSLIMIAFVVSIIVGGVFSDKTISSFFSEPLPFYLTSGLYAGALIFTLIGFKEPSYLLNRQFEAQMERHFSFNPFTLFKIPELIHVYAAFLFLVIGWFATVQFLSYDILVRLKGTKLQDISSLVSAGIVFYIASRLVAPRFIKHFCNLNVIKIWTYTTSMFLIFCTLTTNFYLFFCLFLVTIFSISISWNGLLSYISSKVSYEDQGKMLSLNQLITICGIILSPIFITTFAQKDIKSLYLLNSCSTIASFFILSFKK